jgi:hypothetical protein
MLGSAGAIEMCCRPSDADAGHVLCAFQLDKTMTVFLACCQWSNCSNSVDKTLTQHIPHTGTWSAESRIRGLHLIHRVTPFSLVSAQEHDRHLTDHRSLQNLPQ